MPFGWSSASKMSAWERKSMGRKVIKVGSSHPTVSFRVRGTFPLLPQWGWRQLSSCCRLQGFLLVFILRAW